MSDDSNKELQLSYYDLLQVSPHACKEVIEAAFRALQKQMHPDMGGDHELSLAINEARDVLTNTTRRNRYDTSMRIGRAKTFAFNARFERTVVENHYVVCLGCKATNRAEPKKLDAGRCGKCGKPFLGGPTDGDSRHDTSTSGGNVSPDRTHAKTCECGARIFEHALACSSCGREHRVGKASDIPSATIPQDVGGDLPKLSLGKIAAFVVVGIILLIGSRFPSNDGIPTRDVIDRPSVIKSFTALTQKIDDSGWLNDYLTSGDNRREGILDYVMELAASDSSRAHPTVEQLAMLGMLNTLLGYEESASSGSGVIAPSDRIESIHSINPKGLLVCGSRFPDSARTHHTDQGWEWASGKVSVSDGFVDGWIQTAKSIPSVKAAYKVYDLPTASRDAASFSVLVLLK